jgi:hypothetical protein
VILSGIFVFGDASPSRPLSPSIDTGLQGVFERQACPRHIDYLPQPKLHQGGRTGVEVAYETLVEIVESPWITELREPIQDR